MYNLFQYEIRPNKPSNDDDGYDDASLILFGNIKL